MQLSRDKNDVVELHMERLMLGDHVMGRLVTELALTDTDRVFVKFDDGTAVEGEAHDMVPVDRAWR